MKSLTTSLAGLALAIAACAQPEHAAVEATKPATKTPGPVSHQAEIDEWKARRLARLTSDDGWLTLVGLFWLSEGRNDIGTDSSDPVRLPQGKGPANAGAIVVQGGKARIEAPPDAGVTLDGKPVTSMQLADDSTGEPTVLQRGSVSFYVIKRGEKLAVRMKDTEAGTRTAFAGLDYFPRSEAFRVEAKLEPYQPAKSIPIANIVGMVEPMESPGALVFQIDGRSVKLDPVLEEGSDELYIIFSDQTGGKETYPAGRYVYAPKPGADGKVVIDFNKAYNPPCAFTPFATCPLPPVQNRLPVRIEAGEKKYGEH